MTLSEYLRENSISQVEFATRVGISVQMVNQVCNERKNPSLELAIAISDATNGQVAVRELLNVRKSSQPTQLTEAKGAA